MSQNCAIPGPLFANFCRGCAFDLEDAVDWAQVDTIELLNGPLIAEAGDLDLPLPLPLGIENPFMQTAIELWRCGLSVGAQANPPPSPNPLPPAGEGFSPATPTITAQGRKLYRPWRCHNTGSP